MGLVLVVGRQEVPMPVAVLPVESGRAQQGFVEAALGGEAFDAQMLGRLMRQHSMQQVAPGFDAVARHAVAIDQLAPHQRRSRIKLVGELRRKGREARAGIHRFVAAVEPFGGGHGGLKLLF